MRHSLLLSLMLLLVTPSFAVGESSAEGKIILKESANGSRSLQPFTVQNKWEMRWESSADITIWLKDKKGDPVKRLASNKKGGSGSAFHHTGGTYFLMITAEGDWTVTVIQLP